MEELESYSKQLEEFQTFGDMQDIQRYLKKAQALNQRLESAADKVWSLLHSTEKSFLVSGYLTFLNTPLLYTILYGSKKCSFIFNYNLFIY